MIQRTHGLSYHQSLYAEAAGGPVLLARSRASAGLSHESHRRRACPPSGSDSVATLHTLLLHQLRARTPDVCTLYKVIVGPTKCQVGEEMAVSAADGSIRPSVIAHSSPPATLSAQVAHSNKGLCHRRCTWVALAGTDRTERERERGEGTPTIPLTARAGHASSFTDSDAHCTDAFAHSVTDTYAHEWPDVEFTDRITDSTSVGHITNTAPSQAPPLSLPLSLSAPTPSPSLSLYPFVHPLSPHQSTGSEVTQGLSVRATVEGHERGEEDTC